MGADMLAATISAPASRTAPLDFSAGRRTLDLIQETDAFDLDDPEGLLEQVLEGFDPDVHLDVNGDPTLAALLAVGHKIIDDLEEALDDPREVTDLTIAGYTVYLSAGLSAGDPPTDAAAAIWNAHELPAAVLQAIGFVLNPDKPLSRRNGSGQATKVTDSDVVDAIAIGLGTRPEWSGADELEWIADTIAQVRQHPGDQDPVDYYEQAAEGSAVAPVDDPFLVNYVSEDAWPVYDEDEGNDPEDDCLRRPA